MGLDYSRNGPDFGGYNMIVWSQPAFYHQLRLEVVVSWCGPLNMLPRYSLSIHMMVFCFMALNVWKWRRFCGRWSPVTSLKIVSILH